MRNERINQRKVVDTILHSREVRSRTICFAHTETNEKIVGHEISTKKFRRLKNYINI